ncbi:MAG: glycosyltransferase [Chloroflexi bacterium]|nr:glycosyltransferase [Chloroflexota bacterium]
MFITRLTTSSYTESAFSSDSSSVLLKFGVWDSAAGSRPNAKPTARPPEPAVRIGVDYTAAINQSAGVGRFVRSLFSALLEVDQENEYIFVHAAPNAGRTAVPPSAPNAAVRELRFRERFMTVLWHRLNLPLPLDLATGRVDVFHAPDFALPPLRHGASVVTIHDLAFLTYPECADARLRAYLERVVPRSVARADYVVTVSENTRNDVICLLDVDPDRVIVVPGGVDPVFEPASDEAVHEARSAHGLSEPYLLALGVIEPRKNYPRLIEAYSRFRSRTGLKHELVIAGARGWLSEETFRQAARSAFPSEIRFTGFVPDVHLPALYTGAEVLVYPSLYEGFGLPVLEAMACGTPVVCSNVAAFPEFAGDAALLVTPEDPEAIADAIERICLDTALRGTLRDRGIQRARAYQWRPSAERLLQVYQHAAKLVD